MVSGIVEEGILEVEADCMWACTICEEGRCGTDSLYEVGFFRSPHPSGYFGGNMHHMTGQEGDEEAAGICGSQVMEAGIPFAGEVYFHGFQLFQC